MRWRNFGALLSLAATLSSCGGGGGSSVPPEASSPTPTPASTSACALRERQDWAAATLQEWYLYPETLPASLDPSPYADVGGYIDALTARARGQGKDRFFTYLTSIREEEAFNTRGATAGFGFRLQTDGAAGRAFVSEVFETAPAFAAGMARGDEIIAVGDTPAALRTVADIIAAQGAGGVSDALGPTDPGVTRTLRLSGPSGTREITVTKADYALQPISGAYGAKVLEADGRKVGYLNLRTFIDTADPQLRDAFRLFQAEGVRELIVDFRYNGGGLVATAQLLGDLLGRARFTSDVQSRLEYRPSKSSRNETRFFRRESASVAPVRIAFISTGTTASASEFVINSQTPYLAGNLALVGEDSFGKPVGQVAIDRQSCDDRLRVVAFSTKNASGFDGYFDGLAAAVPNTCQAADDIAFPLGDAHEASVARALDFLAGRPCAPIAAGQTSQRLGGRRQLLTPAAPNAAQREVPGLF